MSYKYSQHKIAWFPDKLCSMRDEITTSPIYIRIKPINRCCHNCSFCVYKSSTSNMHKNMNSYDEISLEKMKEILTDIKDIGVKAITYSGGGEPLIHKDIEKILEDTINKGFDLSLLTNGQFLTDTVSDMLLDSKWIRISMDYVDGPTFVASNRGTLNMFDILCNNIKDFTSKKHTCDIGVNFIITKENYKHLENSIKLLIDLGIENVRYSPVWFPNFVSYHSSIQTEVLSKLEYIRKTYSNKMTIYDSYKIKEDVSNRTYNRCYSQQIVPVIGADCNIYTCHNKAYSEEGKIGSIKNCKFRDIWFSEKTKFHFNTFNPTLLCKHQCANDKKNIFINELINCYGDNFI